MSQTGGFESEQESKPDFGMEPLYLKPERVVLYCLHSGRGQSWALFTDRGGGVDQVDQISIQWS